MKQVACIHVRSFERKAELGGGFRAIASVKGEAIFTSDVLKDQAEGFRLAYDAAMKFAAGRTVSVGHYRGDRFRKNYFVWA